MVKENLDAPESPEPLSEAEDPEINSWRNLFLGVNTWSVQISFSDGVTSLK